MSFCWFHSNPAQFVNVPLCLAHTRLGNYKGRNILQWLFYFAKIVSQKLAKCLSYVFYVKLHLKARGHICLLQKHHDWWELNYHTDPSLQALRGTVNVHVNTFLSLARLLVKLNNITCFNIYFNSFSFDYKFWTACFQAKWTLSPSPSLSSEKKKQVEIA